MQLQNKTALITGGGRGIGLAFARRYVDEGARVAIADIDVDRAQAAAETIGSQAIAVQMDVADQNSIKLGVAQTIDRLGHIDILINNAAVGKAWLLFTAPRRPRSFR